MTDYLGLFLAAYEEYFNGKRDYADLPPSIYPGARMNDPYRTAERPMIERRMDSHDASRKYIYGELSKWASRTTWHFAAIILLAGAVLALSAYVADQHDQIRQLQRNQDQLRCEMGWHEPVGWDSGVVP